MPASNTNGALNNALAAQTSSLVQYAGECRPWSDSDEDTEEAIFIAMAK